MASVWKHPNSRFWTACYTLPDGRRTKRSTKTADKCQAMRIAFELEAAARKADQRGITEIQARELAAQIFEICNGESLPAETVREYMKQWQANKESDVAESSMREYRMVCKDFLSFMGRKADQPIEAITHKEFRRYKTHLLKRLSPKSVNKYLKTLRSVWSSAEKDGLLKSNEAKRVDLAKVDQSTRRGFNEAELETLLKHVEGEWRGLVLFGLYTGQRLGDLACLAWRNVDLLENEIRLTTTKTGRHIVLPILKPIADYLAALDAPDDADAPIFPNAFKRFQVANGVGALSRQFGDLLIDCGIRKGTKSRVSKGTGRKAKRQTNELSFHSLRHSTTTLLKQAGVSDAIARAIVGHESEAVSRQYTHLDSATIKQAMSKLKDVTS